MSKTKKGSMRFFAASSAPFSDDDAAKFGPVLCEIAESLCVNSINNIDKHRLFEIVRKSGPKHPLYAFVFNNSASVAERAYRIERCRKLISGMRYVDPQENDRLNGLVKSARTHKLFVSAVAPIVAEGSGRVRKSNVHRPDLLRHSPAYISAVSGIIQQIRDALAQLEDLVTSRTPPKGAGELARDLRACLDTYEAAIQDVAAE